MKKEQVNNEQIVGLSIPDEDIQGWIEELHAAGLSNQEIDLVLSDLNQTYFEKKLSRQDQEIFDRLVARLEAERGSKMDVHDRKRLMDSIRIANRHKRKMDTQ